MNVDQKFLIRAALTDFGGPNVIDRNGLRSNRPIDCPVVICAP